MRDKLSELKDQLQQAEANVQVLQMRIREKEKRLAEECLVRFNAGSILRGISSNILYLVGPNHVIQLTGSGVGHTWRKDQVDVGREDLYDYVGDLRDVLS